MNRNKLITLTALIIGLGSNLSTLCGEVKETEKRGHGHHKREWSKGPHDGHGHHHGKNHPVVKYRYNGKEREIGTLDVLVSRNPDVWATYRLTNKTSPLASTEKTAQHEVKKHEHKRHPEHPHAKEKHHEHKRSETEQKERTRPHFHHVRYRYENGNKVANILDVYENGKWVVYENTSGLII